MTALPDNSWSCSRGSPEFAEERESGRGWHVCAAAANTDNGGRGKLY